MLEQGSIGRFETYAEWLARQRIMTLPDNSIYGTLRYKKNYRKPPSNNEKISVQEAAEKIIDGENVKSVIVHLISYG